MQLATPIGLEVFDGRVFWQRLGQSQDWTFFLRHTDRGGITVANLFTHGHCLMEDVCGKERVTWDDSQTNEHVKAAIISQCGANALASPDTFFNVVSSGPYTGVGLGSNVKKRAAAAKVALAIRISVATLHSFKSSHHKSATLANDMVAFARERLEMHPRLRVQHVPQSNHSPLPSSSSVTGPTDNDSRRSPMGPLEYSEAPSHSHAEGYSEAAPVHILSEGEPIPCLGKCGQAPANSCPSPLLLPGHGHEEAWQGEVSNGAQHAMTHAQHRSNDVSIVNALMDGPSVQMFEEQTSHRNCTIPERMLEEENHPGVELNSSVRIHGLRTKTELNGKLGKVMSLSADKGRWNVQFNEGPRKMVSLKPVNMTLVTDLESPSSSSCRSTLHHAASLDTVWCPTAFQIAQGLEIDHELIFKENSLIDGPFVGFGEIVCSERYILWQACICNRAFRRAPVNLQKMHEFPHMTLAKLEHGYAEKQENKSTWFVDAPTGPEEFDVSGVLADLNRQLRHDTLVYRLHAGHLSPNYYGCRYDITGGPARAVFRQVQSKLRSHLSKFGDLVQFWATEPAHPHITFEYPDEDPWCSDENKENETLVESAQTFASRSSSMEIVLDELDKHKLGRLRSIFQRERISLTVLPSLTDQQLKEVGIGRLGDRQKVLNMASELQAANSVGKLVTFQ